jgi:hypothetical protein
LPTVPAENVITLNMNSIMGHYSAKSIVLFSLNCSAVPYLLPFSRFLPSSIHRLRICFALDTMLLLIGIGRTHCCYAPSTIATSAMTMEE